jgi:hypothetical protein
VSLHRRAAKRDTAERPIIDALRACGFAVQALSIPDGPDLLLAKAGRHGLAEVKTGTAKLRPGQRAWIAAWPAPVYVLRSVDDAVALAQSWSRQST